MKHFNLLLFFSLVFFFASCGNGSKENAETAKPTEEGMRAEIKKMEDSLFTSNTLDPEKANAMIGKYNDFADLYPESKEAPEYLMKAADIATAINKPLVKEKNYKRILEKYPDYPKAEIVTYLLAFTLDADLNDREQAKGYYQKIIDTAKDTNFVRDAKIRMSNIDSLTYDQFIEKIISQPTPVQ
jgi:outer membrane protein assembly factor BamD (BamD/ComL family)